MLPSARIFDHGAAQNPRRPVEIEKQPVAASGDVLQHEMPVQQHRLHFRQNVVMPVQIRPSRLHHADLCIREEMHRALQKIGRRNEIGVENRDDLAGCGLQSVL